MRITPSELAALAAGQSVDEQLSVEGGWKAVLGPATETSLTVEGPNLCVSLCKADIERLASPENEGVYFQDSASRLHYFVEKDFPCAHPRAAEGPESAAETFEAPTGFKTRKN